MDKKFRHTAKQKGYQLFDSPVPGMKDVLMLSVKKENAHIY